jgi:hypothetical protein
MDYFKGTRPFFDSVEEMQEWMEKQRQSARNQILEMDRYEYPVKELPLAKCQCPKPDSNEPQRIYAFGWHCPVHSPRMK